MHNLVTSKAKHDEDGWRQRRTQYRDVGVEERDWKGEYLLYKMQYLILRFCTEDLRNTQSTNAFATLLGK